MILLDTHALIWLAQGDRRARVLLKGRAPLYVSPVNLYEIHMLLEVGRLRLGGKCSLSDIERDERWRLDDPPSSSLFAAARPFAWTRDPFDRLLVSHATFRGWRLATSDTKLLEHLPAERIIEL